MFLKQSRNCRVNKEKSPAMFCRERGIIFFGGSELCQKNLLLR